MAPRGQSRTKLINAMRELSLAKGYPATTVDEVCAAADVSKGSFYHHFETKEHIAYAALDGYFADLIGGLTGSHGPGVDSRQDEASDHPADDIATSAVERLHEFLGRASVVCSGPLLVSGCMLGSFALDMAETHPGVRQRLDQQFTVLADYVAGLIDAAAAEAGVVVPAGPLARQFLALIQGSIVLAKAHNDRRILPTSLDLYAQHLDLLLDQGRPTR